MIGFFRRISDERYKRAMRRRRTEEIMGWICVPVLVLIGWFSWQAFEQMNASRGPAQEQFIPSTTTIRRN